MQTLNLYIGYDSKEPVAWHVLAHSILRQATGPITITPLVQSALRASGLYTRERGPKESTEFSMTRFLCPALSNYEGYSVFMDSDMLAMVDICELWQEIERSIWERETVNGRLGPRKAVLVCQHDYTPAATIKFLGAVNIAYPRKNWSSFMVFDNAQCKALTPERVNILSGLELHRFSWLNDAQIGALPLEWNYLVGEANQSPNLPKVVHFTEGGPWFEEYRDCEYAAEWFAERDLMLGAVPVL